MMICFVVLFSGDVVDGDDFKDGALYAWLLCMHQEAFREQEALDGTSALAVDE